VNADAYHQLTDELAVHRQLMRMHGFSLMSMVLTGMADDQGIVLLVGCE
jgi:histone-lysine N-methyltransferase SETD2